MFFVKISHGQFKFKTSMNNNNPTKIAKVDGASPTELLLSEIWMRDPYIVILKPQGRETTTRYLLFGTTDKPPKRELAYARYPATGFDYYESENLTGPWIGPQPAFRPPLNFWSSTQYWAPEVVNYNNAWYMTATFGGVKTGRSCQILRSPDPMGPFKPFAPPVTPFDWFCLDGHLYFGEAEPCIVFCREWVQVSDGEMYCAKLSGDLSRMISEPVLLFRASDAPWTRPINEAKSAYVTDGPFIWRSRATRELMMLWSSLGDNGYSIGISRSTTGSVFGPWIHDPDPFYAEDGGHCMLFRPQSACPPLWDGNGPSPLVISLHRPNKNPMESRPCFYLVEETVNNGKCVLKVDTSKWIG